jgi:hypothetical protein
MSRRTELPWSDIQSEIVAAIDQYNECRRFVNVSVLTTRILQNPGAYPVITSGICQMTRERTVQSRITRCLKKHHWPQFSVHSTPRGGGVFVDERY